MGRDRPVKQFMLKPRCDKTQYLYFKSYSKSSLILLTWFSSSSSWASSSLWKLPKEKGNESSNQYLNNTNGLLKILMVRLYNDIFRQIRLCHNFLHNNCRNSSSPRVQFKNSFEAIAYEVFSWAFRYSLQHLI